MEIEELREAFREDLSRCPADAKAGQGLIFVACALLVVGYSLGEVGAGLWALLGKIESLLPTEEE